MSFLWPTGSTRQPSLSDRYGPRGNVGNLGTLAFHHGVDVPMVRGSIVYIAADGEVIFSGWFIGETVVVRSIIDGFVVDFIYPHMESGSRALAGTKVRRGDAAGTCGTTGQSTGPHVCFRVIVNGNWRTYAGSVDPVIFMAEHNAGGAASAPLEEDDMYNDTDRAEAKLALDATARVELGVYSLNKKSETMLAKLDLLLWAVTDKDSGLRTMLAGVQRALDARPLSEGEHPTVLQVQELTAKMDAILSATPTVDTVAIAALTADEIDRRARIRLETDKPSITTDRARLNTLPVG